MTCIKVLCLQYECVSGWKWKLTPSDGYPLLKRLRGKSIPGIFFLTSYPLSPKPGMCFSSWIYKRCELWTIFPLPLHAYKRCSDYMRGLAERYSFDGRQRVIETSPCCSNGLEDLNNLRMGSQNILERSVPCCVHYADVYTGDVMIRKVVSMMDRCPFPKMLIFPLKASITQRGVTHSVYPTVFNADTHTHEDMSECRLDPGGLPA